MKNFPDQIEYQGQSERIGFKPLDIGSAIPELSKELNRQQEAFKEVARQDLAYMQRYNQVEEQNQALNRSFKQNDWRALSSFSKTLSDYVGKVTEQTNADKEVGAMWDEFMRGLDDEGRPDPNAPTPPGASQNNDRIEAEAINEANRQGDVVARTAVDLEQKTNNPVMANMAWNSAGQLARGVRGEEALLIKARAGYNGWLNAWMLSNNTFKIGGKEVSVSEAVASGDPALVQAAITAGRFRFIKENGLQHTTKRSFVKYMMESMLGSEGSVAGTTVLGAIKQQREERLSELDGIGYDLAQTTGADGVGDAFATLSRQYFQGNVGLTQAQANERAVQSLIKGYEDAGNVDALEALLDTPKVPGQAGTELRRQYGDMINDAIRRAKGIQDENNRELVEDIEGDMYRELAGAQTSEERDAIIERAASSLEQAGRWKDARRLRQDRDELSVAGANELNTARLEEGLRTGAVTADDVEKARLRGDITAQQAESLLRSLPGDGVDKGDLQNPVFKGTEDGWGDRAENELLNRTGLKKDMYGRILPGQEEMITDGEAEVLRQQMRTDIRRVTETALRMTAGQSEDVKLKALNTALKDWYEQELNNPNGKYYLPSDPAQGKIKDKNGKEIWDPKLRGRLQNLLNSPGVLSRVTSPASLSVPFDWSSQVKGGNINTRVRSGFRRLRGDRLFSKADVENLAHSFKQGDVQQVLQRAATGLGMSPLALLNQQLGAYGLAGVTGAPVSLQSSSGDGIAPSPGVAGANTLMRMGFPAKGAAWLSGNIMQESRWHGQRQPWDDGGALSGGLVSWRAGRLQNAEAALGGDISRASNQEQLRYMVQEMRTKYNAAYRIFMNPMATERQLMRASEMFWGYGEEGQRFTYARQIEQSVKRRGRPQKPMGGDAVTRTIEAGRQLLAQGVKIWQHPNFDFDRGFVANGTARVGTHSDNSYHYHAQALDIPLAGNGKARLDAIYRFYNQNRSKWGVAELLWQTDGHYDHLHIAFK